jgi:hypothetical protein
MNYVNLQLNRTNNVTTATATPQSAGLHSGSSCQEISNSHDPTHWTHHGHVECKQTRQLLHPYHKFHYYPPDVAQVSQVTSSFQVFHLTFCKFFSFYSSVRHVFPHHPPSFHRVNNHTFRYSLRTGVHEHSEPSHEL